MSEPTGSSLARRVLDLPVERPWRSLVIGLLLAVALAAGGARLKTDTSLRLWLDPEDVHLKELEAFERRFGHDMNAVLAVYSPSGIFDRQSASLLVTLTERMKKVTEIIRVDSLSNFQWVHAEGDDILIADLIPNDEELTDELLAERRKVALGHPQLPGFLVSPDGKAAVIIGWLQPAHTLGGQNDYAAVAGDLEKLVAEFKGKGDEQFYLAGSAIFDHALNKLPEQDAEKLMPVMLGACLLLLVFFFRRASGVLLPLAVVVPSIIATVGSGGWIGLSLNPMTNVAPMILIGIAISNSVHVLVPYYRAFDAGFSRREAARHALEEALLPNFFACFTLSIGFLSFVSAPIVPLRQLGIMAAVGALVIWILIWLVLTPLLIKLPIRPKKRAAKDDKAKKDALKDEALREPPESVRRLIHRIDRHRKVISAVWLVVAGLSLFLGVQNRVDQNAGDLFPKGSTVRAALDAMKTHMGWYGNIESVIDSGKEEGIKDPEFLRKVEAFEKWIQAQPRIVKVTSFVDIIKQTNRSLHGDDPKEYRLPDTQQAIADEYAVYTMSLPVGVSLNDRVSLKNDALRMSIYTGYEMSSEGIEAVEKFRAKAKELGLDVRFTGQAFLFDEMNPYLVNTMLMSLIFSLGPMVVLLIVLFRSVRLGLFSIIPDLVPLAIGSAVMFLAGQNYDIGSVIVFSIALGMSVDDTVHWLSVYNRARRQGLDPEESVARTYMILPAVVIMTVIIATCFAVLMLAGFTPVRNLGMLVAIMLITNLIADATLMPALLLLRRRGWAKKK